MTPIKAKSIALASVAPKESAVPTASPDYIEITLMEKLRWFVKDIHRRIRNLRSLPTAWAYRTLCRAMQKDPEYARVWHANIAMPIYDSSNRQIDIQAANRAATVLMRHLFYVNIE